MKVNRKIIEIDEELCDGCGQCIVDCAEAALEIVDGKAKLVADKYCDGLGACMGGCPTGALKLITRNADDFDEEAVEELLKSKKETEKEQIPCGCPSQQIQNFQPETPCQTANRPVGNLQAGASQSALSHWPIQIRLIPPEAPFLKNADLLVAADCVPPAYAAFHQDLLTGRVVMLGCPKFDDAASYVQKFTEIFKTAELKSITIAIMEVPCCGSMRNIIKEALKQSGKKIKAEEVVISARGEILHRGPMER
ncbi:MAG: 4Fe-4S ferredoxin [Desulfobulbaceae bacterium]|nr:4Fe-4S ferredoxin [Desulfobulbaceae bacterium]